MPIGIQDVRIPSQIGAAHLANCRAISHLLLKELLPIVGIAWGAPPASHPGGLGGQHITERRVLRIVSAEEPGLAFLTKRSTEDVHQFPHFLEQTSDRESATFTCEPIFAILPGV